jgi:hypothetical protein
VLVVLFVCHMAAPLPGPGASVFEPVAPVVVAVVRVVVMVVIGVIAVLVI